MVTLDGTGREVRCPCGYQAASMSAPVYPPAQRTFPGRCPRCNRHLEVIA